jgi:hypothetical protein
MMGLNALINGNLTIAKWDVGAGYYLINGSPAVLAIVTNRNVIAIDQDPAQIIGWPVQTNGTSVTWIKPLGSQAGPSWAIGLQNLNTTAGGAAAATFSLTNLPSWQGDTYYAQDVWSTNAFLFTNSFTVTNIEQQMRLYVISPHAPPDLSPPILTIARFTNLQAVKLSFSALSVGSSYHLQVSGDLNAWTNQGSSFTATNSDLAYPQYWDVDNGTTLFFRLQLVP